MMDYNGKLMAVHCHHEVGFGQEMELDLEYVWLQNVMAV